MHRSFLIFIVCAACLSRADETNKGAAVISPRLVDVVTNAPVSDLSGTVLFAPPTASLDSIHLSSVMEATRLKDQLLFGEVLARTVCTSETMAGLYEFVTRPASYGGVDIALLPCDECRAFSLRVGHTFSIAGTVLRFNAAAMAKISGDRTDNNTPTVGLMLESWSSGK